MALLTPAGHLFRLRVAVALEGTLVFKPVCRGRRLPHVKPVELAPNPRLAALFGASSPSFLMDGVVFSCHSCCGPETSGKVTLPVCPGRPRAALLAPNLCRPSPPGFLVDLADPRGITSYGQPVTSTKVITGIGAPWLRVMRRSCLRYGWRSLKTTGLFPAAKR